MTVGARSACRSINPKTASIDTPFNLDTLRRAPLGVASREHSGPTEVAAIGYRVVVGEIERVVLKRSS